MNPMPLMAFGLALTAIGGVVHRAHPRFSRALTDLGQAAMALGIAQLPPPNPRPLEFIARREREILDAMSPVPSIAPPPVIRLDPWRDHP